MCECLNFCTFEWLCVSTVLSCFVLSQLPASFPPFSYSLTTNNQHSQRPTFTLNVVVVVVVVVVLLLLRDWTFFLARARAHPIMGHASILSTRSYQHADLEMMRAALAGVAERLQLTA